MSEHDHESWAALHHSATTLLAAAEGPTAERIRTYLAAHADAMSRYSRGGAHLTTSAVLVNPHTEETLLTLHPRFGRWMQLGGHFERDDLRVTDTVMREVAEESGLTDVVLDAELLSVGAFPDIPCPRGSSSTHFDLRFLVMTGESLEIVQSEESLELVWWPLRALPQPHDYDLAALAEQALARLARR